jgi:hypothetical protein
MQLIFHDPSFSYELVRAIGYAVSGGADIGECLSTASRIQEGDCESWYQEWCRTAQRVQALADAALETGSRVSAREAYLRASNYYRSAEFYLHTTPDDPRSLPTWEKSRSCFRQALALSTFVCEEVEIPYEGTSLPGYFYQVDRSETPRPTLLIHGGYDSTGEELYFQQVYAALARGYHCLVFEGPGAGSRDPPTTPPLSPRLGSRRHARSRLCVDVSPGGPGPPGPVGNKLRRISGPTGSSL